MRVFISAGEASGDAYGAALIDELGRLTDLPLELEAIGGPRLKAHKLTFFRDSSKWGAISIVQSLRVFPRIYVQYIGIKRQLRKSPPGLLIPIDFGFFNIRLTRAAKKAGWKVLWFVPPGSWRRDRQGKDVAELSDRISTPFEWSAEIYNEMGAKAFWFGHPLKQLLAERRLSLDGLERKEQIAVLPGSRVHEIEENLPLIVASIHKDVQIEFGLAPTVDREEFQRRWRTLAPEHKAPIFTSGDAIGVLLRSTTALVCSGTATLEAALCRTPMVVIYKISKAMEREAKLIRMKRPKFVALPNILVDKMVVPELIACDAAPDKVAQAVAQLLNNPESREEQLQMFDEVDRITGPNDAITKTAELAVELLNEIKPRSLSA